jgi:hypothetical protein
MTKHSQVNGSRHPLNLICFYNGFKIVFLIYHCSKTYELGHNLKKFIGCPYTMILSCILIIRYEHIYNRILSISFVKTGWKLMLLRHAMSPQSGSLSGMSVSHWYTYAHDNGHNRHLKQYVYLNLDMANHLSDFSASIHSENFKPNI